MHEREKNYHRFIYRTILTLSRSFSLAFPFENVFICRNRVSIHDFSLIFFCYSLLSLLSNCNVFAMIYQRGKCSLRRKNGGRKIHFSPPLRNSICMKNSLEYCYFPLFPFHISSFYLFYPTI